MNTNMKALQGFYAPQQGINARQILVQFSLQAVGRVAAVGVAVFLILAWILTSPFIHLMDRFTGSKKVKTKKPNKQLTKETL
jgi:hypothetical protein